MSFTKYLGSGLLMAVLFVTGCRDTSPDLQTSALKFEVNDRMHTKLSMKSGNEWNVLSDFTASEQVVVDGVTLSDFNLTDISQTRINDNIGRGEQKVFTGINGDLEKTLTVTVYDAFPSFAVTDVAYRNTGSSEVIVSKWMNNLYSLENITPDGYNSSFWSYQSGSSSRRADWVLPVNTGFTQQNYMGQNNSDYGGGTPVSSLWRPDGGFAVGHIEPVPKLVSLPVQMTDDSSASTHIEYEMNKRLSSGERVRTFRTFVRVQSSDYFATLVDFRNLMIADGMVFPEIHESAYEPQWCAWGYEREFTMEQVYETLPKVGDLDYHWVVLDDGWQTNVGDWELHPDKYPAGDADMARFVNTVSEAGFRSKLWWAPLAMHPDSDVWETNPEYLLLNEEGEPEFITWWNAYYMCPAYQPVVDYHTDMVDRMFDVWGYEGLKLDGQHLNGASACHNPAHNHDRPEESVEAMPTFFKALFDTATDHVHDALMEICPCGTAYAFHLMPYMTQGVSSDPTSSWQVRHKGRTLKALMGRDTPFYGDHVELSRNGTDFASQIGIGAIIGTKFTWPVGAGPDPDTDLTPEREEYWRKWSEVYQSTRLAEGEYIGELYDIGFDRPETHVIKKNEHLFFAFYSDQDQGRFHDEYSTYVGSVEFRGLQAGKSYRLYDYENSIDYGTITGPVATIDVDFTNHLLIQASPQ
ncbi:MAG: alpha-galactosidase [Balneolales bacterium]|nr:alpha-galactosidase [Balneolales bacterium]